MRKEIPILFSTDMVTAILEGRKTMTRRVVKPQPEKLPGGGGFMNVNDWLKQLNGKMKKKLAQIHTSGAGKGLMFPNCPYGTTGTGHEWKTGMPPNKGYYYVDGEFDGKPVYLWPVFEFNAITWGWHEGDDPEDISMDGGPTPETIKWKPAGDLLYVRETWQHTDCINLNREDENSGYIYKASENGRDWESNVEEWTWRPGIHLPKIGSRIWLEVVNVRVERLQDITEEDAKAEGVEMNHDGSWHDYLFPQKLSQDDAKASFISLWHKINGVESWASNPWVWVVEFKVLSTTGKPE